VSNVTKFSISPKNIESVAFGAKLNNNYEEQPQQQSASVSQTGGHLDISIQSIVNEDQRHVLMNNLIHNIEMRNTRRENLRKKHVRRCAKELQKEFPCLYNCGKEYATDAARNMHMREKHNEVTKTERDRKAREIIRTCGLKNNTEIVNKLSQLTQVQQNQLQSELLV